MTKSLLGPRMYLFGSKVYNCMNWLRSPPPLRVKDILARRRPERQRIYRVEPQDTAYYALQQLLDHQISCLLVEDEHKVLGLLTDTDYLYKIALAERDHRLVRCEDIMTPVAYTAYVCPDNTVESCMAIMAEVGCHHLPVLSESTSMDVSTDPYSKDTTSQLSDLEIKNQNNPREQTAHVSSVDESLEQFNLPSDPVIELSSSTMQVEGVISLAELVGLTRDQREENRRKFYETKGLQIPIKDSVRHGVNELLQSGHGFIQYISETVQSASHLRGSDNNRASGNDANKSN